MTNLKVSLIQADLVWHDAKANFRRLGELIDEAESADVIVVPEMFSTGFTMKGEEHAEPEKGPAWEWMNKVARETGAAITGSVIVKADDGNHYNRMYWVEPNGEFTHYDKRHLFRMAGEHEHYSPGQRRVIVEYKGWRILLQVCYDLRFPVWMRNRDDYDAMICVANWPSPRVAAWDTLLAARSIENLAYSIGVNRVGVDGNQMPYSGHSRVLDPKGQLIAGGADAEQMVIDAELDGEELERFREKFPAMLDADEFEITGLRSQG